jgi:hypothetical protein
VENIQWMAHIVMVTNSLALNLTLLTSCMLSSMLSSLMFLTLISTNPSGTLMFDFFVDFNV